MKNKEKRKVASVIFNNMGLKFLAFILAVFTFIIMNI